MSSDLTTPEEREQLLKARNDILGPSRDRGRHGPVPDKDNKGQYKGGTAFERDPRAARNPVKPGTRAYNMLMSHEPQTGLHAPSVLNKAGKEQDEWQKSVRNIVEVRSSSLQTTLLH